MRSLYWQDMFNFWILMLPKIGPVEFFLLKRVFEHPLSNVCVSNDNQGYVASRIQYLSSQYKGFPLFISETL